jgi:hypothetical protein
MTKLEIFNRLMEKAKEGGYTGSDYKYQLGYILEGTNIYSLIFREDFMKAVCGTNTFVVPDSSKSSKPIHKYIHILKTLTVTGDKWKYLEENAL